MPALTRSASQLDELIELRGQLEPETRRAMADAFAAYIEDVRAGRFPDLDHSYPSE